MKPILTTCILALATLIGIIKCDLSQVSEEHDDYSDWSSEENDYVYYSPSGIYGRYPSNTFSPNHYNVTMKFITVDDDSPISQYKVKGSVRIFGTTLEDTDKVQLEAFDSVDIADNSVKVSLINLKDSDNDEFYGGNSFLVASTCRHPTTVEIALHYNIPAGTQLEIYIEFESQIESTCDYRWYSPLCTTKDDESFAFFSSPSPSFMFPCFTEVENDVTVQLTLVHNNDLHNTIVNNWIQKADSYVKDGLAVNSFFTPNPIPIEEMFFIISNYSYKGQAINSQSNRSVRIHAPPNAIAVNDDNVITKLADISVALITTYENYLGVEKDSEFPPLDIILAPDNASEIYSRAGILVYPNGDPAETLSRVYDNLVTSLSTHWVKMPPIRGFPDYDSDNENLRMGLMSHLRTIALKAINKNDSFYSIAKEKELAMFTGIFYNDWTSTLRMFETFITPSTFQKGVSCFVHTSEKTVADFYLCMQTAVDEDGSLDNHNITVEHFMENWRNHFSYPLLRVKTVNETFVEISQEKFSTRYIYDNELSSDNDPWIIPIFTQTENGRSQKVLLLRQQSILLEHNTSQWLIVNPEARGYHRTLYDDHLTELIQIQLETEYEAIDSLSRFKLLDDYYEFAREDYVNLTGTLKLMKYATEETQPEVYNTYVYLLDHLHGKFLSSPNYTVVQEYISKQLGALWDTATLNSTTAIEELLALGSFKESKVLQTACKFGASWCFPLAQNYISKLNSTDNFLEMFYPGSLAESMLCSLVANGGTPEIEFAWAKYNESLESNYFMGRNIANAMTCTTDPITSLALLDLGWNVPENFYSGMEFILWPMSHSVGYAVVLPYITDNFQRFIDTSVDGYSGSGNYTIIHAVTSLSEFYSTNEQLDEIKKFTTDYQTFLMPFHDELEEAVKRVAENVLWMDVQGNDILDWLRKELSS